MIRSYSKFYLLFLLIAFFNFSPLFSQDTTMAPEFFIFSWQKANGDEYKIPVKNNLDINIEQQKVNRVLMQILLKSLIRSKDFEFFNPIGFTLIPEEKNMVAQLIFNKLLANGETEEFTDYFVFDTYGNILEIDY